MDKVTESSRMGVSISENESGQFSGHTRVKESAGESRFGFFNYTKVVDDI